MTRGEKTTLNVFRFHFHNYRVDAILVRIEGREADTFVLAPEQAAKKIQMAGKPRQRESTSQVVKDNAQDSVLQQQKGTVTVVNEKPHSVPAHVHAHVKPSKPRSRESGKPPRLMRQRRERKFESAAQQKAKDGSDGPDGSERKTEEGKCILTS